MKASESGELSVTRFDQGSRGHLNCLILPFSQSSVCSAFCFSKNTWLLAITYFGCVAPDVRKPTAECLEKVSSLNYGKRAKRQQRAAETEVESQLREWLFHLRTLCQMSHPKITVEPQPTHRWDNPQENSSSSRSQSVQRCPHKGRLLLKIRGAPGLNSNESYREKEGTVCTATPKES